MAAMDLDAIRAQVRMIMLVEDVNVSDVEIDLLVNSGVDEVSLADEWPFLEASATLTLVASTQTYALPAAFEYMLALVDDDNDKTIPYIDPQTYFNFYGNDTGNESTEFNFWTIWEDVIYITPTPSTNDTNRFTTYYYKTGTQLASGTDVPDWHEAFHQILVEYVKWKLWDREEYFFQSERAFITYSRYLEAMSSWYARRAKRMPAIYGDGVFRPRAGDPNVPLLNQ